MFKLGFSAKTRGEMSKKKILGEKKIPLVHFNCSLADEVLIVL